MEGGEPQAPIHKRPRLDSLNPPYNHLPPPNHIHAARHPAQPSSPALLNHPSTINGLPRPPHYPPHSAPSGPAGPYRPHQAPSPFPPTEVRTYPDPSTLRPVVSPHDRPHVSNGFPVTLPAIPSVDHHSAPHYPHAIVTAPLGPPEPNASRSASIDAKPQSAMEPPSAPWSATSDRHHGSVTPNGFARILSPTENPEPQFHAPALPSGYATPAPNGAYMAGSPAYAAPGTRRKQVRAQQACNHCRQRKQKCDEQKPCQFCRDNNIPDCTYKEVPPPKQDKSMQQLQSSVNHIQDTLAAFIEGFNTWKREVDSRNQQSKVSDSVGTPSNQLSPEQTYPVRGSVSERSLSHVGTPQGRLPFLGPTSVKTESPIMHMSPLSAHAHTPGTYDHIVASVQHPSTPADSIRTDSSGAKQDGSKTDTSGIQGDHATPAHKVLQDWKCMTGFCDGIETIRILKEQGHNISDYPMKLEYARGIVRPFGVGEGNDKSDGSQAPATPCSQASDTPSPPGGGTAMWGTLSTPPPDGILLEDTPGGLGRDGYLKLDEDTLTRLLGSYQKHIHTLHPFLNPGELRRMVKAFGRNYGPNGHTRSAGTKRKRSAGGVNGFPSPFLFAHHSIERSLSNAIVLLVLALGKVCEWKSPLPAPQADKAPPESTLYGFKRASLRNANNTSFSSDYEDERRARNMEILPGMAYFSMATDILGNQIGGNTTGHAQAMLLAGLYMGQYARVLESWSWINSACRVCLVLVKEELPFIRRLGPLKGEEKDKNRRNVIKCVYWTCLQLESDIIAEMSNLTPTDISKYWDEIAYPEGVLDDDELRSGQELDHTSEHVKMMFLYSMQIYLRTLLNSAHNALYNGSVKGNLDLADHDSLIKLAAEARSLQEGLRAWRNRLPPEYRWNDGDPPSTDLNIARLRAKYYGGKYMIHRTFLNMLLHNISLNSNKLTAQMLESATTCIDSAIYSTIAFDRVGMDPGSKYEPFVDLPRDRLIVTNIMGTLHAQFGNMTVLCSVFKSRKCGEMLRFTKLTREVMELLIVRTIKILRSVGDNSPILTLDADILENVQRQLFPKH